MIKVFILHNKQEAPQRTKNALKLLSMFDGAEIFEAIYPNTITEYDKELLDTINSKKKTYNGYNYGYVSNLKIFQRCIEENYQRVLILEDDAELLPYITMDMYYEIITKMKNIPIIYLGGNFYNKSPNKIIMTDAVLFNNIEVIKDFYNHILNLEKIPDGGIDLLLDIYCRERKNRLQIKIFKSPHCGGTTIMDKHKK